VSVLNSIVCCSQLCKCDVCCRSGWKKDYKGNWIKDEDVEFDSDEEPPDIL
jgi:hypothetical protein